MTNAELLQLLRDVRPFIDRGRAGSADILDRLRAAMPYAPVDEAAEMERRFQNGGPRVYLVTDGGSILSCSISAYDAAATYSDATTYARRKVGGRYRWLRIGRAQK